MSLREFVWFVAVFGALFVVVAWPAGLVTVGWVLFGIAYVCALRWAVERIDHPSLRDAWRWWEGQER